MALVVDNFINNPLETRSYALSLPFTVKGNYPGVRTHGFADRSWIPYLETYLPSNEKITWFDTHPFSYNGAFQLCSEKDGRSWIHHDMTDWAAILFLTPDAPIESGLTLYRHKRSKALGIFDKDGPVANKECADMDAWEIDCTIGNVFNRLVMFRGSRFHKASVYFGSGLANSRLFQTFFFNTTSAPLLRWNLTMPRVVIVIMTTNRYEYLEKTLQSLRKNVSFAGCCLEDILLLDDYPLARDRAKTAHLVKTYGITRVFEHETNQGLPATWKHAWDLVRSEKRYEWIFQIEDDIEFVEPVLLKNVIDTYAESPIPLTQLALKRQPCYDDAIDIFTHMKHGTHGEELLGDRMVTQHKYFMTMASLFPREIVDRYPDAENHQEHSVAHFFATYGMTGAVYGPRDGMPHIMHLGTVSRGRKGRGFEHLPVDVDYDFLTGKAV